MLKERVNAVAAATELPRLEALARTEALLVEGLFKLEPQDPTEVRDVFQAFDAQAADAGFPGFSEDSKLAEGYARFHKLKPETFKDKWLPPLVAHRASIWRQALDQESSCSQTA